MNIKRTLKTLSAVSVANSEARRRTAAAVVALSLDLGWSGYKKFGAVLT
jgi:hypothetical protein